MFFRRKATRPITQIDPGIFSDESSATFDDENTDRRSSRSILISTRPSALSSTYTKSELSIDDIPPAIPPRKPMNKKSDSQTLVTRLSTVQSTKSDEIFLSDLYPSPPQQEVRQAKNEIDFDSL